MFTIILIGAAVLVILIVLSLVFLERQIAHKAAAGLVGLYLALIGLSYFQSQFEKRDSSFDRDRVEMKSEFFRSRQEFYGQLNGSGDPAAERVAREGRIAELDKEAAALKADESEKIAEAKKSSEETKTTVDQLRVRAKNAVESDDSEYLPPADSQKKSGAKK
ncbi:hypothetical protein M2128_000122 [Polynucleobacter sphagniphilus]|uniref:hypothetical protein n=1 Tax=Polynucleobacter sphagniphilus TaxID=1743169 RepID=UPI002475BC20|nr:hypothetical protein [Polynucleobacter sphagniphilus]MDH6301220.1 hypothetical protein [Polynucleobacter sphagniphilus]